MIIQHPWLLVLLFPTLMLMWRLHPVKDRVFYIRLTVVTLMFLGLSNPNSVFNVSGEDYVVIVDQSDSMHSDHLAFAEETIQDLESELESGDRLAIISVGGNVQVDKSFEQNGRQQIAHLSNGRASKLSSALDTALKQIPVSRRGNILLLSDGGNTEEEWTAELRSAIVRNIPIHTIASIKETEQDIQITQINAPHEISQGEGVLIQAQIESPFDGEVTIELLHQGKKVASGSKSVVKGANSVSFRDMPINGGIHEYTLRIKHPQDRTPENNTVTVGTLVQGPKTVLLLSESPSPVASLLGAHNMEVIERHPKDPISLPLLTQVRAIILHNVPATYFSINELKMLRIAVEELGKGLWMIGGPSSFGVGGYLHTELEDVLPVNLEIREEKRKVGMALGIALDRSGSMGMSMGPNLTKMDLANQGAASALKLLTNMDNITVTAVDTETHEILRNQPVSSDSSIAKKVLGIESGGGGIYVDTALKDLHTILKESPQQNKRIILFADAGDAEDDGDALKTVAELQADNIAVSVIALGTPGDSDAKFLMDVASQGGGSIYFTQSPKELPQLFSMETMVASQAGFIEEPTPVTTVLGLSRFGGGLPTLPTLTGYNVVFPKSGSQTGYQTKESDTSPILASTQVGLGQTVAYMGCIGGTCGQQILRWPQLGTFASTIISGISSSNSQATGFVGVQQEGDDFVYTVESNTGRPDIQVYDPDGNVQELVFQQIEPNLYEARVRPDLVGIHTAIQTSSSGTTTLPPLSKSISTEFSNLQISRSRTHLRRLSERSGGLVNPSIAQIMLDPTESQKLDSWRPWILCLLLPFLLLEIVERRLQWVSKVLHRLRKNTKAQETEPKSSEPQQTYQASKEWISTHSEPSADGRATTEEAAPQKKQDTLQDALQRAKNRK